MPVLRNCRQRYLPAAPWWVSSDTRSKTSNAPPRTPRAESDAQLSYLAFVLRSGESVPAIVSLGSAATVDALILQWRRQLDQEAMVGRRSSTRSEIAYRRVAEELRQRVWDPLATHLSNVTRVFVVPDGALHLVSLAALPTGASQYLVETGPLIHYFSAERDLVPVLSARRSSESLLALGGPAFDESASEPVTSEASFRGARSACGDFQAMQFAPLPAAVKEVEQVTTLWNKAHGIETGGPGRAMRIRRCPMPCG